MSRIAIAVLIAVPLICVSCHSDSTLLFDFGRLSVPMQARVRDTGETASVYELSTQELITPRDRHAAIAFRVAGEYDGLVISLFDDDRYILSETLLPVTGVTECEYLIPIHEQTGFNQIHLEVEGPSEDFAVVSVGFAARNFGVTIDDVPEVENGVSIDASFSNGTIEYLVDLSSVASSADAINATGIEIRYRYVSDGPDDFPLDEPIILTLSDESEAIRYYRLNPHPGGGSVYLYQAIVGFRATKVRISSENDRFELAGVYVARAPDSKSDPVPADFTTIIDYARASWRHEDYEIFRWTRYPSILVFDTRNYEIQSAIFLRLAFFVEKPGYVGIVLTDKELSGRHGWNAHDYRSVDLAEFFSAASEGVLNPLEISLRETLVSEGVIIRDGDEYAPGEGGLISISQESTQYLRNLFMLHEGWHGVFFADEGFRAVAFSIWSALDYQERMFWRRFLAGRYYNSDDEYLMVNEFQAYILQQPLERVIPYFRGWAVPRFKTDIPGWAGFADEFLRDYPNTFYRTAETFLHTTWAGARVHPGSLYCLQRIDAK